MILELNKQVMALSITMSILITEADTRPVSASDKSWHACRDRLSGLWSEFARLVRLSSVDPNEQADLYSNCYEALEHASTILEDYMYAICRHYLEYHYKGIIPVRRPECAIFIKPKDLD